MGSSKFGVRWLLLSSLSGWWCWDVGCCMWLLIRYMLFKVICKYVCVCLGGLNGFDGNVVLH